MQVVEDKHDALVRHYPTLDCVFWNPKIDVKVAGDRQLFQASTFWSFASMDELEDKFYQKQIFYIYINSIVDNQKSRCI